MEKVIMKILLILLAISGLLGCNDNRTEKIDKLAFAFVDYQGAYVKGRYTPLTDCQKDVMDTIKQYGPKYTKAECIDIDGDIVWSAPHEA
jgi:hypothetical protein